jgi:hypothetical protein
MARLAFALTAALPLALASLGPSALAAQAEPAAKDLETVVRQPETKAEKRLAKLLEGRVAGKPTTCIRALPSQRMQTIEGVAYVYGSGNTIYVQRTRNPEAIDDNDTLVVNRFNGTQLCRLDVATTIDRFNGFFTGAVFFEDFVPYTLEKREAGGEG